MLLPLEVKLSRRGRGGGGGGGGVGESSAYLVRKKVV